MDRWVIKKIKFLDAFPSQGYGITEGGNLIYIRYRLSTLSVSIDGKEVFLAPFDTPINAILENVKKSTQNFLDWPDSECSDDELEKIVSLNAFFPYAEPLPLP